MQREKFFIAGAGSAAALLLAARGATAPAEAAPPSVLDSDADVWRVRGRVAGIITQLSGLSASYNGHRLSAISELQAAKSALDGATKVRPMTEALSDSVVTVAIAELTDMINRLNGDLGSGAYGGQKQVAIDNLSAAQRSLQAALKH